MLTVCRRLYAGATLAAGTTPSSGESSERFLQETYSCGATRFRNDDYLAKANIPVDMGIIDRLLAEDA